MRQQPLTKIDYILIILLSCFIVLSLLMMFKIVILPRGIDSVFVGFDFGILGFLAYRAQRKVLAYFIWFTALCNLIVGCVLFLMQ